MIRPRLLWIGCQLVLFTRGSRIRAFDWYRTRWPWTTSNDLERRNSPNFAFFHRIRLLCWPITSQWLKVDRIDGNFFQTTIPISLPFPVHHSHSSSHSHEFSLRFPFPWDSHGTRGNSRIMHTSNICGLAV